MNMKEIKNREGRMSKLVADFMDNKREISRLQAIDKELKTRVDNRMVMNNCKVLFYNGEYVEKCDNPKVSIDVARFKNATSKDEFMQCVKVDVAKARKVLLPNQVAQLLTVKSGDKLITGSIIE
jgi:hypothetical protein